MAQQKGMKRAAKVLKRNQRVAKAQHKSNVKRLVGGHHHHDPATCTQHDHSQDQK